MIFSHKENRQWWAMGYRGRPFLVWVAVLQLILQEAATAAGPGTLMDTCDGRPHQVTVNSNAQAFIGVIVGASEAGEGMYGCGAWKEGGVAAYEALRWAAARVNKDSGGIGTRIVSDSFVPGVKFGFHVYDSCGHTERAVTGLGEIFPILREGPSACSPLSNDTMLGLGVVDLTGITSTEDHVAHLLKKYHVPVINTAADTLVPPQERGKVLVKFMHSLKLEATAVLVAEDHYSMELAQVVVEMSSSYNVCISALEKLPPLPVLANQDELPSVAASVTADVKFRRVLRSALLEGGVSSVVVIATGKSLSMVLRAMRAEAALTRQVDWVFSDLPNKDLNLFRELSGLMKGIFVTSYSPRAFDKFEDHWQALQDINGRRTRESEWVLSYLQQEKKCRLKDAPESEHDHDHQGMPIHECQNLHMRDDDLDVLVRARSVLPAVHGAFTLFNALKNAWKLKCRNRKGVCNDLQNLDHKELLEDYLTPLKFRHDGPGSRSPSGLKGGKERHDSTGHLTGVTMGLYRIRASPSGENVTVGEVLTVYNGSLTRSQKSLLPRGVGCPLGSCASCINILEEDIQHIRDLKTSIHKLAPTSTFLPYVLLPDSGATTHPLYSTSHNPKETKKSLYSTVQKPKATKPSLTISSTKPTTSKPSLSSDAASPRETLQMLDEMTQDPTIKQNDATKKTNNEYEDVISPETSSSQYEEYIKSLNKPDVTEYIDVVTTRETLISYNKSQESANIDESMPLKNDSIDVSSDSNYPRDTLVPYTKSPFNSKETNIPTDTIDKSSYSNLPRDTLVPYTKSPINSKETNIPADTLDVSSNSNYPRDTLVPYTKSPINSKETNIPADTLDVRYNSNYPRDSLVPYTKSSFNPKETNIPTPIPSVKEETYIPPSLPSVKEETYIPPSLPSVKEENLGNLHINSNKSLTQRDSLIPYSKTVIKPTDPSVLISASDSHLKNDEEKYVYSSSIQKIVLEQLDKEISEFNDPVSDQSNSTDANEKAKNIEKSSLNDVPQYEPVLNKTSGAAPTTNPHVIVPSPQTPLEKAMHSDAIENIAEIPNIVDHKPNNKNKKNSKSPKSEIPIVSHNTSEPILRNSSETAIVELTNIQKDHESKSLETLVPDKRLQNQQTPNSRPRNQTDIVSPNPQTQATPQSQIDSHEEYQIDSTSPTRPTGVTNIWNIVRKTQFEVQNITTVEKIEPHILLPSENHIILTGLFPIHAASEDGSDCSATVNPQAVQEMEAFLWAVEQINLHKTLLPDTTLGALVLDTCSSRIRTMNQVTSLVKNSMTGINADITDIKTFITSLDPETARVTGDMLSSLNITSINLGASQAHSPYALQMSPPMNIEAEAIVQILRFLGWDYVSLVVSSDDTTSVLGAEAFRTVAHAARVCVGADIKIRPMDSTETIHALADHVVDQLIEKSADGARGVVLFITELDTGHLLAATQRAVRANRLLKHQVVFLASTSWGDHEEQLRNYDREIGGAIVLKDGQEDVKDFIAHYRLLTPDKNLRNPWFTEYWQQQFGCRGQECAKRPGQLPIVPYRSTPSTPRVIQAVFSFAAALTQLLSHLCPHADGRMCPGIPRWRQRLVMNEFLRNTEVSRVDKPSEYFQFTENFHGNAPLEILNLRRQGKSTSAEYKYEEVGRYVNSNLDLVVTLAEYHNGTQTRLDRLPSSCLADCLVCQHQETDYVFVESPDKLYIAAAFNIHKSGQMPLECGPLDGDQGIQNVESFLWALDLVNKDKHILPGVQLGAIIFDACSSKEKIVRDVTNFLTGRVPDHLRDKLPSSNNIVGVVTGGMGAEVHQIIDVMQPYGITTLATQATSTVLSNTRKYPVLLRLASPNDVMGRALGSLLLYWQWEVFSIVYSDGGSEAEVLKHLLKETEKHNLKPALTEAVPLKVDDVDYMIGVWGRIAEAAQQGARVIVLLLEHHHAKAFLEAASKLRQEGLLKQGDFVYLMGESPRAFITHETDILGSLVVQPISGNVGEFENHFLSLNIANHTTYPWFHEFWSRIFKCQGAGCFSGPRRSLEGYRFRQAEGVVATADAVKLLSRGLERWRREACHGLINGTCDKLLTDTFYREKLFQFTRSVNQESVDGRPITFTVDGYNRKAALQMLNYRRLGGPRAGMLRVGIYNDQDGLDINATLVVTYDAENIERSMADVKSQCIDLTICGTVEATIKPVKKKNGYMQIFQHARFGISGLIPYHRQGKTFFSCGEFYSEGVYQNLVAVAYALDQINHNDAGINLGAILFDYCDRTERARERLFSFFSGEALEADESIQLAPNRIVASISFDDLAAEAVSNILSSNYIPHFSSPVGGHMLGDRSDKTILTSIPSRTAELRTILSIMAEYNWKFVSVIYDNDRNGKFLMKSFREFAIKDGICLGDSLGTPLRVSEEYAQELIETLVIEWKPRVIVLLMDDADNIRTILNVAGRMGKGEHFVFLAGSAWGNKVSITKGLDRVSAGALTFTMETYDLPDFRAYLSNHSLEHHGQIPDVWFEEYFQNKFQCRLSNSEKVQRQYLKECLGTETIHPDEVVQDPYVFHTILGINTIAHGLNSYIQNHCADAETIEDCNVVQAELLLEILIQSELALNNTNDPNSYDQGGAYGYHIWNYRKLGREYGYANVGKWENSKLRLEKPSIEFKIGTFAPDSYCEEGICLEVCSSQSAIYASMALPEPLPLDANFRNVYGISTSAISLVGVLVTLVIMIYFMMAFPTAAGTSVLGYMILIGCLMLYSVNFAFIFQPTIGTCAVRRFLMGVAYSVVFSAMLVKVIHTWRIASYKTTLTELDALTKPSGLLLVSGSLVMVQVILGAAWLILYPPGIDLIAQAWRCTPTDHFETELIISLVYVMVLLLATVLFCFETWHVEENAHETRWILFTSILSAVTWCVWTVVATQAPIHFRDPAIVIGNIVCATVIMIFLFARKLYVYSQMSQCVKDLEMRSHYTATSSIYNTSIPPHKLAEELVRTQGQLNNSHIPGRQFVGDQEVSFRTVTLPPETPTSSLGGRGHFGGSRRSKSSSRRSLRLGSDIREDFDVFESSEEDDPVDAHHLTDDEDSSEESLAGGAGISRVGSSLQSFGDISGGGRSSTRQPSIRRVGSRQMLVFLTDGNTIGDVSRI